MKLIVLDASNAQAYVYDLSNHPPTDCWDDFVSKNHDLSNVQWMIVQNIVTIL